MNIYDVPILYERAFSYRDYEKEAAFVSLLLLQFGNGGKKVLELACGPAEHGRHLSGRGFEYSCLDSSEMMISYISEKYQRDVISHIYHLDMSAFSLDEHFDFAINLIDSISHLNSLASLHSHLSSVYGCLSPGGLYLIEFRHPSDVFGLATKTEQKWEVDDDLGTLEINWGVDSHFDPITQCETVRVKIIDTNSRNTLMDCEQRLMCFSLQEVIYLSDSVGFEIVSLYGDFDINVAISDKSAWRTILLIRKPSD